MKKIIISIGIIAIAAIGIGLFFLFGKNNASNQSNTPAGSGAGAITTGSLPTVPIASTTSGYNPPTGATLTLGTSKGSVTVNNFYNNEKQISADHTSILIVQTTTYTITYYAPDSSFNILITETPFATFRAQAEAAFMQELGVSQADACKLSVAVAVPYSVDSTDADQNLGLSFCASGAFQGQ